MRTVAPQITQYLDKNLGTEPILIFGIQWSSDGSEILYSDQKINGENYPYPHIISIGGFDTALLVTGSSDSQSISVVLDDVDGSLKEIFNTQDINKKMVNVYFLFEGLNLSYKVLLFQGEINSPIVWNEGERTLTLNILTRIEDAEVGFSMEEGDFPNIPEEALGKAWPLVFGQICNMQAVKIRSPRQGFLKQGEGIHDFTLSPRICQLQHVQCATVPLGQDQLITRRPNNTFATENIQREGPDLDCVQRRFELNCNLFYRLEQEMEYEHSTLEVRGGDNFPQNENITININGGKFRGYFIGETFYITDREHPEYADWDHQECREIADHAYGPVVTQFNLDDWLQTFTRTSWILAFDPLYRALYRLGQIESQIGDWQEVPALECNETADTTQGHTGGPAESWEAFESMEEAGFFWAPAGSEVYLDSEDETLYIVSLIPGTVNKVAAYRKISDGRSLLMEVPTDYYTVYETDYTGYTVVEIGVPKKLSLIDSDWSDDIYVSFTSTVGPNPVDIIEWLLGKYTNLTADTTTFTAVKSKLTNYPCNFWVKERLNVLDLIKDIAYQSRCVVYIRSNIVYIKYLSEEPTSVRTFTEDDIIANSLVIKLTETEDIVTKHTINWQKTEAGLEDIDEVKLKLILKHNVSKYQIKEEAWSYYTQNTYETILKSATFWMIRKANSWKLLQFTVPLKHLDLEIFDCITINVQQFSSTSVKVIITNLQYNPASDTIDVECWTPIRAGETEPYFWAWPANQTATAVFPLVDEEEYAGAGYTFTVTPPIEHLLRSGYVDPGDGLSIILSAGDRYPSDLDDSLPTVTCSVSDYMDLEDTDPAFEALEYARHLNQQNQKAAMTTGQGSNYNRDKDKKDDCSEGPCGGSACKGKCVYQVKWMNVNAVRVQCNSPCNKDSGNPCTGDLEVICRHFTSKNYAENFHAMKAAEIAMLAGSCGYTKLGGWQPYQMIGGVQAFGC